MVILLDLILHRSPVSHCSFGTLLSEWVLALILVTWAVENGRTYVHGYMLLWFQGNQLELAVKGWFNFPLSQFLYGSFSKIYRNGSYISSLKPLGFWLDRVLNCRAKVIVLMLELRNSVQNDGEPVTQSHVGNLWRDREQVISRRKGVGY